MCVLTVHGRCLASCSAAIATPQVVISQPKMGVEGNSWSGALWFMPVSPN
ncbi:hypothetical protein K2173_010953 [Erythroxylum novogranatense]|uniref:Uncharacterized protein n=1 Tax=Erythroxylum novogranatense TaxID=1862640 RepID=A0AAV8T0B3_9ROSI|nr:hypothetical protein K2173_010953 [Erythroxylum novogranatense]